jgi:RNA polymerase sigma-70 factor (ECF subfamily)
MSADAVQDADAELVLAAQLGSSEAFAALYDRHAPGVARVLASFAGPDRDLVDDLVQDVFLRVVRGLPSYAPVRPFASWLYTIALNVGRNHVRDHAAVLPVEIGEADDIEAPSTDDAEVPALLMQLVAALPAAMRDVVSLRVGSDLAYREIAVLLGIPEATARSRMHGAVNLLRRRYATAIRQGKAAHGRS